MALDPVVVQIIKRCVASPSGVENLTICGGGGGGGKLRSNFDQIIGLGIMSVGGQESLASFM